MFEGIDQNVKRPDDDKMMILPRFKSQAVLSRHLGYLVLSTVVSSL